MMLAKQKQSLRPPLPLSKRLAVPLRWPMSLQALRHSQLQSSQRAPSHSRLQMLRQRVPRRAVQLQVVRLQQHPQEERV